MAPRKKANKNSPQPAPLNNDIRTADTEQLDLVPDGDDLKVFPESQQNEFLTTQAIYPDDFVRIRGRKDAWSSHENLAFQVQLSCLENREIFVKLDVEFPRNYPKVQPKISVLNTEPKDSKFQTQIEKTIKDLCKSNQGSECVYEITAAIDEYLNRTAVSRAAKQTPFSLEEERANRELAAQAEAQEQAAALERQIAEQRARDKEFLASRLAFERKRRQEANSAKTEEEEEAMEAVQPGSVSFHFDHPMMFQDPHTEKPVSFTDVTGTAVILRQPDKDIYIVSPVINSAEYRAPQFVLKHIYLPANLVPDAELRSTMREVETLLEQSKNQRHDNVVDLYGYKVIDPEQNSGIWQLSVLTEYAKKGNLNEQLDLIETLSASKTQEWLSQIVSALLFFDQQSFVHPAIHPGNVLLFYVDGIWSVKLSDGYGTKLRRLVDRAQGKTSTLGKVDYWQAPEVRESDSLRSSKACIWDLGVVALTMVSSNSVTSDFASPSQCIRQNTFASKFWRFLNACFTDNPTQRLRAYDLRTYDFFFDPDPKLRVQPLSESLLTTPRRKTDSASRWQAEWTAMERLGKGGQGSVFKAKKISDQALYAVKILKANNDSELQEIRQEVSVLSNLRHSNIVRYYDTWVEQETPVEVETTSGEDTNGGGFTPPKESTATYPFRSGLQGSSAIPNTGHDFIASSRPRPSRRPGSSTSEADDEDSDSGDWLGTQEISATDGADDGNDSYDNAFDKKAIDMSKEESDPFDNKFDQIPDPKPPGASSLERQEKVNQIFAARHPIPQKSTLYIQMELCSKQTLSSLIRNGDFQANQDQMWRVFRLVLDALRYIHKANIAHRDLKPDNIFIDEGSNPRIGDFGLATTKFAAAQAGEVGTVYYIAPEIRQQEGFSSKVDMYSLGIILFEMNYLMRTAQERFANLESLNKARHVLPAQFDDDKYRVQKGLILELIDHNPDKRPDAEELISRPDIPDPMDDEKLRRQVAMMLRSGDKSMFNELFSRTNDQILDRAWDQGFEDDTADSYITNYVGDRIRAVFHRHGAVTTTRQALFPKAGRYDQAVTTLAQNGLLLQLPFDLTLPFARSLGHQKPNNSKYYAFGTVFRQRAYAGDEPFRFSEVAFDNVSIGTIDLALKDAETVALLDEILREIPSFQSRPHTFVVNHLGLLDLILEHCGIEGKDWVKIKTQLSKLYLRKAKWPEIAIALNTDANIGQTYIAELGRFHVAGDIEKVRSHLRPLLEKGFSRAKPYLDRLQGVLDHLRIFGIVSNVVISPLSNNSEYLYNSDFVFQCLGNKTGFLMAAGGRYDRLIAQHHNDHSFDAPRAVGFRLNPLDIANYIADDLNSATKRGSGKPKDRTAVLPPRIDVVVTSFDAAAIHSSCFTCAKALWGVGLSAEVSRAVSSMEELEEEYAPDSGYWLVIVKGAGPLKEDKMLKVRGPGREEWEKPFGELAGWLKVEVQRRRK